MAGKEMNMAEAMEMLQHARWGRLATYGPDGPYITPLHFVLSGEKIYFHCAPRGRKIDNLGFDHRVCFEVSEMLEIVENINPCKFNTRYKSVLVFGRAALVHDTREKVAALNLFPLKYSTEQAPGIVTEEQASGVTLIALHIEVISGKKN